MNKRDKMHTRIRRRENSKYHESSESWAVSYSDFLMVILSFFIIYFNFSDKESVTQKEFNKLVIKLADQSNLKSIVNNNSFENNKTNSKVKINFLMGNSQKSGLNKEIVSDLRRDIASVNEKGMLKSFKSGFDKDKVKSESVVGEGKEKEIEVNIDFTRNLYGVGEFFLNDKVKKELDELFKVIGPSKDHVNIIFIGHTDDITFAKKTRSVVNNNLILSSMRAAKAVEYALQKGFSENRVFVQGINNQTRNTRSLSLRLVEK